MEPMPKAHSQNFAPFIAPFMFLSIDLVESNSVEIFHLPASAVQFHLTERNQSSIEALHPLRLAFASLITSVSNFFKTQ